MKIVAVALNTYREAIRDKVLYVLLVFAAASILGSKMLGWISIGQDNKIITNICLASVSVFGTLIAIFVGTSLVYKEVDKRTIYTILSRPMWRYEFILGKYFGLALLIAVTTTIMTVIAVGYIYVMGGSVTATFFQAVFLIYCKLLLITALSVLLSAMTSPILGAFIVFSCYVVGHATGILVDLPAHFDGTFAKQLLEFGYYVLPNLSNFDIWAEAANGVAVRTSYFLWAIVYGTVYTTMLLFLATLAFDNKDV